MVKHVRQLWMRHGHARQLLCGWVVLAIGGGQSPWERLEPAQRAKLVGSLILLTIGGISMVVLAWLALRAGRRHLRREHEAIRRRQSVMPDDWASRPLVDSDRNQQVNECE